MPQITLMVGPPGSGKSTEAQRYLKAHNFRHDLVRINQDEQGKEGHVDEFEKALSRGYDIIIDRMNFDKKQRSRYLEPARKAGYTTRIIVLHVSKSTCLERCNARTDHPTIKDPESAGRAVNFFFSNYERVSDDEAEEVFRLGWVDIYAPKVIICDLDGTLCNVEHRRPFVRPTVEPFYDDPREIPLESPTKFKKNWKAFFNGIPDDTLNKWCGEILHNFKAFYLIVLCSGRDEQYRKVTVDWLNKYEIQYDALYMRGQQDSRQDFIIKEVILDFEILTRYNPYFIIDDRQQVVDMWRRRGFVCLQCDKGNF